MEQYRDGEKYGGTGGVRGEKKSGTVKGRKGEWDGITWEMRRVGQ